jgi:uncharacterized protein YndB with AHSA1/START domain
MGESVRVSVHVAAGPEETWPALHDPARLGRWFGDLTPGWRPGAVGRIDFGDGDFFDVSVDDVAEPERIDFTWQFLGLGPCSRVRWSVTGQPEGSEVTVDDDQDDRTPAEAGAMVAGWSDFLDRLARYLRTGEPTRYDRRDDIDGSVTLPGACFDPLDPGLIHRWLPIATDGFGPRWFFVVDDEGPRRFRIEDWRHEPGEVRFRVEIPQAARPTACSVRLEPVAKGQRLSFVHAGWCRLGLPDYQARLLRRRFTASWIAALTQAEEMATR